MSFDRFKISRMRTRSIMSTIAQQLSQLTAKAQGLAGNQPQETKRESLDIAWVLRIWSLGPNRDFNFNSETRSASSPRLTSMLKENPRTDLSGYFQSITRFLTWFR